MLNYQMFGTKKLATHHPTPWNEPSKPHVSNWAKNSHTWIALHQELIATKSSWFHLQMQKIQISPKLVEINSWI
jgi:hypothetical protein